MYDTNYQKSTLSLDCRRPLSTLIPRRKELILGLTAPAHSQNRMILEASATQKEVQCEVRHRRIVYPLYELLQDDITDENRNSASDPTFLT